MTEEERNYLRAHISQSLKTTAEEIADLAELTKPIPPENAIGRVSRMDAINNRSINEAALRKAREKLTKLKLASQKIDDPIFGQCTRCEAAIPIGRLMLMPQSNRCVRCADR